MHERCANCDLQFERSPGDTWGFWVIGDRIFIAAIVAAIFLGYRPTSRFEQALLAAAAIAALIWTMPHRQGVCVALDYLLQQRLARILHESCDGAVVSACVPVWSKVEGRRA